MPSPGEVGRGGDAGVHHRQRLGRARRCAGLQQADRLLEGAGLGDVAGQHLGAVREAELVERYRQRDQWAITALLLLMLPGA